MKLPTLLEGEALTIWLQLSEEEQSSYDDAQKKIVEAMMPMGFISLNDFHRRKLRPGEAISVFVHNLKKLLGHAMPDLNHDQLLHQFLARIPDVISRQLRASGETKSLPDAVERVRLLMTIEAPDQTAAVASKLSEAEHSTPSPGLHGVETLREQLERKSPHS